MHAAPTTKQATNPFRRVPQPSVEASLTVCINRVFINENLTSDCRWSSVVSGLVFSLPLKRFGHLCAPPRRSTPTLVYPYCGWRSLRRSRLDRWRRNLVVSWSDREKSPVSSNLCGWMTTSRGRWQPDELSGSSPGQVDDFRLVIPEWWRSSSSEVSLWSFYSSHVNQQLTKIRLKRSFIKYLVHIKIQTPKYLFQIFSLFSLVFCMNCKVLSESIQPAYTCSVADIKQSSILKLL